MKRLRRTCTSLKSSSWSSCLTGSVCVSAPRLMGNDAPSVCWTPTETESSGLRGKQHRRLQKNTISKSHHTIELRYVTSSHGLFIWAAIRKPSFIFLTFCESLNALIVCVYNSKLYACISLNIQGYYGECAIWSGRIGIYTYLWSSRHSTEERGGVSRAH